MCIILFLPKRLSRFQLWEIPNLPYTQSVELAPAFLPFKRRSLVRDESKSRLVEVVMPKFDANSIQADDSGARYHT